jgi:hypothetical protein
VAAGAGSDRAGAATPVSVLECIGCGAVLLPQERVGTCLDVTVELVQVSDVQEAEVRLHAARDAAARLERLATRLTARAPDGDAWDEGAAGSLRPLARAGLHAAGALADEETDAAAAEAIAGWRRESCGRFEAPRECLGICTRQRVEMVDAAGYGALRRSLSEERERLRSLSALARRVAWTKPRPGQSERTYRAWQADARALHAAGAPGSARRAVPSTPETDTSHAQAG